MNVNEIKLNYIRDKYLFCWVIKFNLDINICVEVDEVNIDFFVLIFVDQIRMYFFDIFNIYL